MSKPVVAVLMGYKSDLPVIEKTMELLKGLGAQIMALGNAGLHARVHHVRQKYSKAVIAADAELKPRL